MQKDKDVMIYITVYDYRILSKTSRYEYNLYPRDQSRNMSIVFQNELPHIKCNHGNFRNISLTHNLCNPKNEVTRYEQRVEK